jgi:phytoene synthase
VSGLAASFEACRRVTSARAKSFYFASHVLPADRRAAAFAVYAFCRSADDAVDAAKNVADAKARLDEVRSRLDAVYAARPVPVHETDLALEQTVRRYGVERAAFDELLLGMEQDLEPVRLRTTAELLVYCHRAAGVVGHLMMPVLGAEGPEARARAADLGVAMQLTNILRDVGEDLGLGRIYLPEEELRAFGLTQADVESQRTGPAWSGFMAAQVERARAYYARADRGMPLIRTWGGRLCARVMRATYGDILRAIEQGAYDTFTVRHRTSGPRKLALLGMSLLGVVPPSGRPAASFALDGPLSLARGALMPAVSHG